MKVFVLKRPAPLLLIIVALMACSRADTGDSDILIKMGPDEPADLVYLFVEEATWEQILEFQRTVVGIPSGTGSASLPGHMSSVRVRVRGHDAVAVRFKPNATAEEKSLYQKRLFESPLIYAVYADAIPSRITGSSTPLYLRTEKP